MKDSLQSLSDNHSLPSTPSASTDSASTQVILHNQALIFIWRMILLFASLIGIVLTSQSVLNFLSYQLVFFTIQSNLLLIIYIGYTIWASLSHRAAPSSVIRGGVTVYITITCLVYNLVLARSATPPLPGTILVPFIGGALNNTLVHIVAPAMAIIDWLLFTVHDRLRWRNALLWLTYPLAYLAFALVRGALITGPRRYPYPFIDVSKIGYNHVFLNVLLYGFSFWLLGILYVAIDHGLARFHIKSETK